jgi:hypothetical protein
MILTPATAPGIAELGQRPTLHNPYMPTPHLKRNPPVFLEQMSYN